MADLYPLTFEPILKEKVWGGHRLARYGKMLQPGKTFGESWELADLGATSASGGGGGEARSRIETGALAGSTIQDAVREWGFDLLGMRGLEQGRRFAELTGQAEAGVEVMFPLLLKYLDAAEHLSVQVHPSPAYAQLHADAHLKTESWVIVEADRSELPDGTVIEPSLFTGVRAGVTAASFRDHIETGTVVEDLVRVDAVPGECHTLPSGTCHALGAGVLVAEVQTPSDTTFRVYDWTREYARKERELHVEQALECIDFSPGGSSAPAPHRRDASRPTAVLAETEFYRIEELAPDGEAQAGPEEQAVCLMVLSGDGMLRDRLGSFSTVHLSPGRTVLTPAGIASTSIVVPTGGLRVLRIGIGGAPA